MTESVGTAKTVEPNLGELQSMLDAKRVFEELGSEKQCQPLVDNPPRLLFEKEVSLRLRKKTNKLRKCKVYIFDDYFVVASRKRTQSVKQEHGLEEETVKSSESGVVWFGSEKTEVESVADISPVFDYDSDTSAHRLEEHLKEEEAALKKFNLKMWIELGKIKPRFLRSDGTYGVSIVYVSKVQEEIAPGEFRFNTVVDCAEIWMENESVAKTILGLIQDVVDKKARDLLIKLKAEIMEENEKKKKSQFGGDTSATDTDGESVTSGDSGRRRSSIKLSTKSGSATIRSKSKRKERLRMKKRSLKMDMAHQSLSEEARRGVPHIARTYKDLQAKYALFNVTEKADEHYIADENEGKDAEFAVNFRGSDLGISFQSAARIGPFVGKLTEHGLAQASGVILGDKVVAINDTEIDVSTTWKELVEVIREERADDPDADLIITFRRKQKHEQQRIRHEIDQREAIAQAKLLEEQKAEESDDGAVKPVEDNSSVGNASRTNSVEFRRVTDDGSRSLRYTLVKTPKGKGKRKWHRKKKFLDSMQELHVGNFNEFRKNKSKLFERFENNGRLFDTVMEYCETKEEQNCVYALKEIYEQEDKYNGYLNHLKGFQRQLLGARKQVLCKHLKSGRPFCEHMRPRRYCAQASSVREEAIDHKVLNSMFLNLTCIVKTNQFLWNSLQKKLAELYNKAANHEKVEMYEMLEVFCEVFIQIAPFLQMYWAYCNRLNQANEFQRSLRAENNYFREIVKPIEKRIGMKLPNLLVKPLQQSMRYHLLFDTLKKHTTKYLNKENTLSIEQKERLQIALNKITLAHSTLIELGNKINKMVGKSAADEQFLEIYEEIGGQDKVPNLMEPSRRFLSKDELTYEDDSQDVMEEQAFFYLFNDKIVVAIARAMPTGRGGSKFSLSLRVGTMMGPRNSNKKRISMESVVTEKKLSLPKRKGKEKRSQIQSGTLQKKLSIRLSNRRSEAVRMSTASKDSKGSKDDIFYDVIQNISMKNFISAEINQKKDSDQNVYGIKLTFNKSLPRKKPVLSSFVVWFDSIESRDTLHAGIQGAAEEYKDKNAKEIEVRENILKGGSKKNSAMPHNKASLFSTGSKGKKLGN